MSLPVGEVRVPTVWELQGGITRLKVALREAQDDADQAWTEVRARDAEIVRHHRDFERWEEMADKGARASAALAEIANTLYKEECRHCGHFTDLSGSRIVKASA